jgi:hypothetical protein
MFMGGQHGNGCVNGLVVGYRSGGVPKNGAWWQSWGCGVLDWWVCWPGVLVRILLYSCSSGSCTVLNTAVVPRTHAARAHH